MSHEDPGKSLSGRERSRCRGPEAVFGKLQDGPLDRAEEAGAGGGESWELTGVRLRGDLQDFGWYSGCEPWQGFEQRRDGI